MGNPVLRSGFGTQGDYLEEMRSEGSGELSVHAFTFGIKKCRERESERNLSHYNITSSVSCLVGAGLSQTELAYLIRKENTGDCIFQIANHKRQRANLGNPTQLQK
jgi:hypothetical protein